MKRGKFPVLSGDDGEPEGVLPCSTALRRTICLLAFMTKSSIQSTECSCSLLSILVVPTDHGAFLFLDKNDVEL